MAEDKDNPQNGENNNSQENVIPKAPFDGATEEILEKIKETKKKKQDKRKEEETEEGLYFENKEKLKEYIKENPDILEG